MEVPSFLVSSAAIHHLNTIGDYHKILFSLPFWLHNLNRSIIYPLRINQGRPFPLLSSSSAFLFTLVNSLMQSHVVISSELSLNTLFGLLVFITGMVINIQSDAILRSLRTSSSSKYGIYGVEVRIPWAGLFCMVLCPHYLEEFIERLVYCTGVASVCIQSQKVFTIGLPVERVSLPPCLPASLPPCPCS